MPGTYTVAGDLSMNVLASTISTSEQLRQDRLVALKPDPTQARNLAEFVAETTVTLGLLSICAAGAVSAGSKLFSASAYVNGTVTNVDVYRLPLS